jgi:hypothetical protein
MLDGLSPDDPLTKALHIRPAINNQPRLRVAAQPPVIVPLLHSAVSLENSDPYTRCLYNTFFLLGRPCLMGPLPRFPAEIDRWHHLPRLYMETAAISGERWTPPAATVEELGTLSGLDGYLAWRRFVRRARLPELVYGKYGMHYTETLMPTDSILAVENLHHALETSDGAFFLQEVFPAECDMWLSDACGRRYVTELAVAWHADAEFWHQYLADSDEPSDDTGTGEKCDS